MISNTSGELIWSNDFLELHHIPDCHCGLFIATSEYIPIEPFKEAFNKALSVAENKQWKHFIFDKRKLNVFHQPSMEWYYTQWKKELLTLGLDTHFKILPQEKWFKTSVDAGLKEIKEKNPDFNFEAFEVRYVDTIEEALDQISQK